jgi:hypothetical protein
MGGGRRIGRLVAELRELPQGVWTPVAAGLLLDVAECFGHDRARINAFFNLGLVAAENERAEVVA